jgi:DNA-directed RNA polymerase subunit RPC12/RpoP
LRPAKDKPHALIIDHVGNIQEHNLPCTRRKWTLDRIIKRRDKVNLIRICGNSACNSPFDRLLSECPYCGHKASIKKRGETGGRTPLEIVDGDLMLLDPETIRELEAYTALEAPDDVAKRVGYVAGTAAGISAMIKQRERILTQKKLADTIAKFAGKVKQQGYTDRMIHKYFYLKFGMTITQALSKPNNEMINIEERIQDEI